MFATTIVKLCTSEPELSSFAVIVTLCDPTSVFVGVPVNTPVAGVKVNHPGTEVPTNVTLSRASTSVASTV